jgi:hypothetical protein
MVAMRKRFQSGRASTTETRFIIASQNEKLITAYAVVPADRKIEAAATPKVPARRSDVEAKKW